MISDEQLLVRAKELNPAALQELHQRFYEPVARYIQFKVGNPQTVEDLSGEVFVRVLEGLKRGHGWRETAQAWIMGIARNVVVVKSAQAVIAIGGSYGTLSEIAHALQYGIPIIGLNTWSLSKNGQPDSSIIPAQSAEDAVELAVSLATV